MLTSRQVQDIDQQTVVQDALSALATDMAALSGHTFYQAICRYLLETLTLDYVFVGKLSADHKNVEIQAGWSTEGEMSVFTYDLAHTPCSNVVDSSQDVYVSGIQDLFPKDVLLQKMRVEAYVGSALFNS